MKFNLLLFILTTGVCGLVKANVDTEIVFKKIGTYGTYLIFFRSLCYIKRRLKCINFVLEKLEPSGASYIKSYWVPRQFRATWMMTRSICQAYGFDIVSLDTLAEMEAVVRMCEDNRILFTECVHVGAMAGTGRSTTDWYWVNSNSRVSYDLPWMDNQPDFYGNVEICMCLGSYKQFRVNDISCYGSWESTFICESKVTMPQIGYSRY